MTPKFDSLITEVYPHSTFNKSLVLEGEKWDHFVDKVKVLGLVSAMTVMHLPITVPIFTKLANDLTGNHPEVAKTIDFERELDEVKQIQSQKLPQLPAVKPPPAVASMQSAIRSVAKPPVKPVIKKTTKGYTPELRTAIIDVSKRNGWNAKYLKAIISFETGWSYDVAQKNRAGSGATGLIQFMPRTAKGLGTTTDKLSKMSQVDQMKYVEKFLKPYLSKSKRPKTGWSLEDMYMAVFYPKAVGKKNSTVLFKKGTTAYKQNIGLDPLVKSKKYPKGVRKGYITKAMAAAKVRKHLK